MKFDEDSFQEEIGKMHDRLYMHFFDDRKDLKTICEHMSLLHDDIVGHEMGFLSEFDFDNLSQDDDDFKSFLLKREDRLSKKMKDDYRTKIQLCVYPNDIEEPFNYKRAFGVALQRFLKDFEENKDEYEEEI